MGHTLATAGLLVLDAYLGEQQRGVAGLLDPPSPLAAPVVTREFAFEGRYRLPALAFGIMPATARVIVTDDELLVWFGLWRLRTHLANVAGTQVSSAYAFYCTAGPAHLSLADRGVTFATNSRRGCACRSPSPSMPSNPRERSVTLRRR